MAKRLPVVMIQSRPPHSLGEKLADELVGTLIGSSGMDLMLVDPLISLAEEAMDRLTLESLEGDVVLLDWKSVEQVVGEWRQLGLAGVRSPHQLDSNAESAPLGSRRLYVINLCDVTSLDQVTSVLRQIQAAGQVKTFALGFGSNPIQRNQNPASERLPRGAETESGDSGLGGSGRKGQNGSPLSVSGREINVQSPKNYRVTGDSNPKNKLDLDALMDELDRIDP